MLSQTFASRPLRAETLLAILVLAALLLGHAAFAVPQTVGEDSVLFTVIVPALCVAGMLLCILFAMPVLRAVKLERLTVLPGGLIVQRGGEVVCCSWSYVQVEKIQGRLGLRWFVVRLNDARIVVDALSLPEFEKLHCDLLNRVAAWESSPTEYAQPNQLDLELTALAS
jgi:hypothetical protein